MNTKSKTDKTAQGKLELPTDQRKGWISPAPYGNAEREAAFNEIHRLTRQRDKAKAHAEALAEALRILNGCAERGLEQSATHDGLSNCKAIADAREALANWEGAK